MDFSDFPAVLAEFRQALAECRDLYSTSAAQAVCEQHAAIGDSGEKFIKLMDDLHRALLVKVFIAVAACDRQWSETEKSLAHALIVHLWARELNDDELRGAILQMSEKAGKLKWYALVRPFDQIASLRNRIGELETIVIRLAHLVARSDGAIGDSETAQIKSIQDELHVHLRPIPIDEPAEHGAAERTGAEAIEKIFRSEEKLPKTRVGDGGSKIGTSAAAPRKEKTPLPAEQLAEAIDELERLVGLADVKHEIRTLANFLKVQTKRTAAGLPATNLSLHMVFEGNPGTGKTSVARIVGKIFGAMGVLAKGHLVETDRSGLVAEYAGQTGPKCHKKIDEALDGVLFIDEAYTLVSDDGKDPYGHEAVQTLLKRMEDDRDRLVVILAGYPQEMRDLLETNPGLSSRFSRQLTFADYSPLELASIFAQMCNKNHFRLDGPTRAKILVGLSWLFDNRDRHFGNGRTVRNLFEHSIRRQANRIAEIAELSVQELTRLTRDDIEFPKCPAEALSPLADAALRFRITCPQCQHGKDAPQDFLGRNIECPKCQRSFTAEWGEVIRVA